MTPPELRPDVLTVRLALITELLDDLEQAGQMTVAAIGPALAGRLTASVGLRNVLVHEYVRADLSIVAAAAGAALVEYRHYVRQVSRWLVREG